MKSNFEERKENRLEAYQNLAAKNEQLSTSSYQQAHKLGGMIPLGQPILIGHHSERGHRAHIKKIDNAMRKSIEADKKADYYAQRAKAIENSNAISSDDPNCIEKLEMKLKGLEAMQELMKDCNKIIRTKKTDAEKIALMVEVGLKEKYAIEVLKPDFCGRTGFPSFKTTNNSANMRRIKDRIAHLSRMAAIESSEEEINGVRLVISQEDNRVQIFFPSIPTEEVRKNLKSYGFHWAPSVGAWMRQLSNSAIHYAKNILNSLNAEV